MKGLSKRSINRRIALGLEKPLKTQKPLRGERRTRDYRNISYHESLTKELVRARVSMGWDLDRATTTPKLTHGGLRTKHVKRAQ